MTNVSLVHERKTMMDALAIVVKHHRSEELIRLQKENEWYKLENQYYFWKYNIEKTLRTQLQDLFPAESQEAIVWQDNHQFFSMVRPRRYV
jgi:hypothetical protein